MAKIDNKIYVEVKEDHSAILSFPDYNIETIAYIGKNGITNDKKEGDGKTPLGEFNLGFILGTHSESEFTEKTHLKYSQIHENMYCVDDSNSKYYNRLVDITKVKKDWVSAEHIIDFPIQYEYLIEIKANPNNIPEKGSAIFLHCIKNCTTEGCVAIDKRFLQKIIMLVNKDTKIVIHTF